MWGEKGKKVCKRGNTDKEAKETTSKASVQICSKRGKSLVFSRSCWYKDKTCEFLAKDPLYFFSSNIQTSTFPSCCICVPPVSVQGQSIYWKFWVKCSEVKVAQSCPTLCDSMDYTVHAILQATILEWVAFPFSRGSSQLRDQTKVSRTAGRFFTSWGTREFPNPRGLSKCLNPENLFWIQNLKWKTIKLRSTNVISAKYTLCQLSCFLYL